MRRDIGRNNLRMNNTYFQPIPAVSGSRRLKAEMTPSQRSFLSSLIVVKSVAASMRQAVA